MKTVNARYYVSIIFGAAILAAVIFGYNQFSLFQEEKIEREIAQHTELIIKEISIKETKINLLGASIVSFYENSDVVTTDEFNQYVKKMENEIPEIKNIFYVKNDKIIQSYPHTEFINFDFESLFPTYPIIMDDTKLMNVDYVIDDNQKIVIAVPFDFFLDAKLIFGEDYKLILYNPLNSEVIHASGYLNGMEITESIEISDQELDATLRIQKKTDLFGTKIGQYHVLDYLIWSQIFEKNIDIFSQLAFIGGIVFAIMIPLFLIRIERYRVEAQHRSELLDRINKRLIDVDRQKSEFASMMAHELKTPLVPILGNTDFLKNPKMIDKLEPAQLEAINSIEKNALRLEILISDLLDVQKIHLNKMRFSKSVFDVKEFMETVSTNLNHHMKEKQITFVNNTPDSFELVSDEHRLQQVLENLVKNSVDFVPERGRIEIGASISDNNALFFVKDNGIGIPQEEHHNLFKKFYQIDTSIKRKHHGTGLGLAICKGIVEGLGGKIWFESEEDKGATFYFSIPLEEREVKVKSS